MFLLSLGNAAIGGIIGGAVALLAIILIIVFIGMRNTLVALTASCDEAWSGIDVYLKKRYDLIPNLVETVKGYAKHESETLQGVIAARNAAVSATTPNERIAADKTLGVKLKSLFALKESYPELKANTQFLSLQTQLQSIEDELSQARKFYNGKCRAYNTKIRQFPSSLAASSLHLTPRNYFELDDASERQAVKVKF